MRIFKLFLVLFGVVLAACGAPESGVKEAENTAAWQLVNAKSRVEFISVKKGTIVEVNKFGKLSGTVDNNGKAQIIIALDSVETNIDIRNKRMREHLFETENYPIATISVQLDKAAFSLMDIGDRKNMDIPMHINLHGKNDTIGVAVIVTRLGDNKVMVESHTPVILDVETFGFEGGVEKLRELANLPSITPEIPVMFSLVFERGVPKRE